MTSFEQPPTALPPIAWEQCLELHQAWLRRVILARIAEPDAVDDVWQQVALAAVEQRWPLTDSTKVAPWLHRLAVIAAARHRRTLGRQRWVRDQVAHERVARNVGEAHDPLSLLLRRERHELTREALRRLAPRDAEVLVLKYGEQWSYGQIATHLGLTARAVDSRLLRARAALREQLRALGIDGLGS